MLYPPEAQLPCQQVTLPAPPPKIKRRHTLPHEEWTEDESPTGSTTHAGDNITLLETTKLTSPFHDQNTSTQIVTPRFGGQHLKRGRDETSSPKRQLDPSGATMTLIVAPDTMLNVGPGHTEKGQSSKFSEDNVFMLRDLLAEAFKLGALLQHGTTYEMVDFLARLHVTDAA